MVLSESEDSERAQSRDQGDECRYDRPYDCGCGHYAVVEHGCGSQKGDDEGSDCDLRIVLLQPARLLLRDCGGLVSLEKGIYPTAR